MRQRLPQLWAARLWRRALGAKILPLAAARCYLVKTRGAARRPCSARPNQPPGTPHFYSGRFGLTSGQVYGVKCKLWGFLKILADSTNLVQGRGTLGTGPGCYVRYIIILEIFHIFVQTSPNIRT